MGALLQGPLGKLSIQAGEPAQYSLVVGDQELPLNDLVGTGLRIDYIGQVCCGACGAVTTKSYGGGYCYDCFASLARCDLCVMAPDRCHYHLGTCREPDWGEEFCMQPHLVYLANATGLKVGITRANRAIGRWLDQGAVQGLVVGRTVTRREAGLIEVELAQAISDRTDWRKLVSADAPPLDLVEKAQGIPTSETITIVPCQERPILGRNNAIHSNRG